MSPEFAGRVEPTLYRRKWLMSGVVTDTCVMKGTVDVKGGKARMGAGLK